MKQHFPRPIQLTAGENLLSNYVEIAASQAAQPILAIPLPKGTMALVDAYIKVATGVATAAFSAVVDATANTFTAVAHGLVLGQPVIVGGTAAPTGVTAGTVYYVGTVNTDDFKLYPTLADAVASTNVVDPTTTGTAVTVTAVIGIDVFSLRGAAMNQVARGAKVIGTPTLVSWAPNVSASTGTLTAATNAVNITLTSIGAAIRVEVIAKVILTAANAAAE